MKRSQFLDMHVHTCKSSARQRVENASRADGRNEPFPSQSSFNFATRACVEKVSIQTLRKTLKHWP